MSLHKQPLLRFRLGLWLVALLSFGMALVSISQTPLLGESAAGYDSRFFQSPTQQRSFLDHLETLLEPGQALSKARASYQRARQVCSKDPRLDYAFGLVLLEHYEYDEAEKCFRKAAERDGLFYLPAWKSLVGLQLLQKDKERFLADSAQLAKLAASENGAWIGPDRSEEAAEWLGEVLEYLALPNVDFLEPQERAAHAERLQREISPQRIAAWTRGKEQLRERFDQLKVEIQKQQEQTKAELQATANRKTDALSDRKDELEDAKKDAKRSATEWKAWFDGQMKQSQTQLTTLQRDYAMLEAVARRLSSLITQTQLEISRLQFLVQQEQNQRSPRAPRPARPSANDVSLAQRQQEVLRYQLQYAALEQQAMAVLAQAQQVVAGRQRAALQYKNATGQIVRRDQMLDRWKKVVEKSALKAAAKANDTDPIAALEKRLALVSSYFPMEFEAETKHLLESYELP